jgi:redox-sensitive bicupin YhaK (pirin superfamily)
MGINELLVINDDTQQATGAVPMHHHANLEIISYHISGSCHHIDTLGNDQIDAAGDVYLMSSGSGIMHSETNTNNGPSRYIQIWFKPYTKLTTPTFTHIHATTEQKTNTMFLLASQNGPLSMKVNEAKLFAGLFNQDFGQVLDTTKTYYLYVVDGSVVVNGQTLHLRDAVKIKNETQLSLTLAACEVLFFEL